MSGNLVMRYIPGGAFQMGSDRFYPEEKPRREVGVDSFWIDETPVTNAAFAAFIADTGHVTLAEKAPDPRDYPGMLPELALPGSLVFAPSPGPVPLNCVSWWHFRLGADWRSPMGPGSSIEGLEQHPVVHVAWEDAEAYAAWAGKALPTEAEWEYAAWGGASDGDYAWGFELAPDGRMLANYWQGPFPHANSRTDGWERTSPVASYPPNGFGLFDMIGNVWEWTADWYALPAEPLNTTRGCCVPRNPRGGDREASLDPADPAQMPRRVLKGGSHLCAESYCRRYRPAARHPQAIDSSTGHIGFRCIKRSAQAKAASSGNLSSSKAT
jgi:formylglycine-generating enzyme required for sulfatase activity